MGDDLAAISPKDGIFLGLLMALLDQSSSQKMECSFRTVAARTAMRGAEAS